MSVTVTLSPRAEALIQERIDGGVYHDAAEVIEEVLRVLDDRDRLAALRAGLQVGIDQLDRGEGVLFTPEWSADRARVARERAAAGEVPDPDVCL
jgi:antitoxin ParD1/3/4